MANARFLSQWWRGSEPQPAPADEAPSSHGRLEALAIDSRSRSAFARRAIDSIAHDTHSKAAALLNGTTPAHMSPLATVGLGTEAFERLIRNSGPAQQTMVRAIREGRVCTLRASPKHPAFGETSFALATADLTILGAPIIHGGSPIGALIVICTEADTLGPPIESKLEEAAAVCAEALTRLPDTSDDAQAPAADPTGSPSHGGNASPVHIADSAGTEEARLREELREARTEAQHAHQQSAKMQELLGRTRRQLGNSNAPGEVLPESQRETARLRTQITQLRHNLAEQQTRAEMAEQLRRQLLASREELTEARMEAARLRTAPSDDSGDDAGTEEIQRQLHDVQRGVSEAESRSAELRAEIAEAARQAAADRQEIESLRRERTKLQAERDAAMAAVEERTAAGEQLAERVSELEQLAKRAIELREALAATKTEIESLREQREAIDFERQGLTITVEEQRQQIEEADRKLIASEDLRIQIADIRTGLSCLVSGTTDEELTDQIQRLMEEQMALREEVRVLRESVPDEADKERLEESG